MCDKRPITPTLNGLQGEYFTDTNLVGASILAALPTLVVFLVLRRQLRRRLVLGSLR